MGPKSLEGFCHFNTHHCVTGSMRHLYVYNDHDLSEEMLLGLGAGVSFSYWHFKGQPPFLGGRGMPKPSMEQIAGQRTGVKIEMHTTSSTRRAGKILLDTLEAGQPLMVQCDMGFLPYFDFGDQDYHFGGHAVVICGYDPVSEQVLIADRDEPLHPVSMADLERARSSTYQPFPPKNCWYTFDFRGKRYPTTADVHEAIRQQVEPMLEPPIRNIGVQGIRKAARMIPKWPDRLDTGALRFALFNAYIFVSPTGGTGGGAFRYMFSRFLHEASEIAGDLRLKESADEFRHIGDKWEELGAWFCQTSDAANPALLLGECVAPLNELAELEEVAWGRLRDIVPT